MKQQNLDAIRQKHAAELAQATRENRILAILPDWLDAFDVRIVGQSDSVWINVEAKRYPFDAPKISLEQVRELADLFPPSELWDGKGTFRHIDTIDYFETPNGKRDYTDLTAIAPFTINYEPQSYSNSVSLRWYSRAEGEKIRINIEFPMGYQAKGFGRVAVECRRMHGVVTQILRQSLDVPDSLRYLGGSTLSSIKWSSGSDTTPSSWTAYYADSGITLGMLLDALEGDKTDAA